jgi:hypothetical protein
MRKPLAKPLAAFAVSFVLSAGITWLSFYRFGFTTLFSVSLFEAIQFFAVIDMLFTLVGVAVFFGVFYFLADRYKMQASRSTVLALLLGVIFGSALYNLTLMSPEYFGSYLLFSASSSFGGIFEFFLPSVIALLFIELRQNRSTAA